MKTKTRKRVMLTLALAVIMACAMSITALAATKVTGLKQTSATTSSVAVQWDAVVGNGIRYSVRLSSSSNMASAKTSTTSTPVDYIYGLSPGKTYYVQVVVEQQVQGSVYTTVGVSDVLTVTTAPDKVGSVKQTKASSKGVTLKWSAVAGATSYNIYRDNKKVATATGTTATIKQTVGTYKYYKVVAVRKVGNFSVEGSYASAYADAVPCKPLNVAKHTNNSSTNNLKWDPASNKVTMYADKSSKDATCDGFQFVIYSANGKKKLKTITTSGCYSSASFTLNAVKNKGFQVMARGYVTLNGKKYYGAWSAKRVVIPQPKVTASLDGTGTATAKIKWAKVAGATKYYVYVAKNQSSSYKVASSKFKKVATVNSKTTSYKISGLKTNTYLCAYVVPVVKVGKKSYKGLSDYYWSWRYYTYYTYN